jgi:hypothetical protein
VRADFKEVFERKGISGHHWQVMSQPQRYFPSVLDAERSDDFFSFLKFPRVGQVVLASLGA